MNPLPAMVAGRVYGLLRDGAFAPSGKEVGMSLRVDDDMRKCRSSQDAPQGLSRVACRLGEGCTTPAVA